MANYSTDTEMAKVDSDITQWLGDRSDYSDIRDIVTARINSHIKKQGWWEVLESLGVITDDMVDKTKILNPGDLEDLENTWVREVLYYDNLLSPDDSTAQKGRELRKERLRLLKELRIVPDRNADGVADADPVKITKLYRA
jgi:hypothetical protein